MIRYPHHITQRGNLDVFFCEFELLKMWYDQENEAFIEKAEKLLARDFKKKKPQSKQ